MKTLKLSALLLTLLLTQPALSCGQEPISDSARLTVYDKKVTAAGSYKIFVTPAQLAASPSWKPGEGRMPMSTAEAYSIVNKWASSEASVKLTPAEAWSVEIKGCPKETVFRFFLFNLKAGPKVAVLFDGTVLTEVRKDSFNQVAKLP